MSNYKRNLICVVYDDKLLQEKMKLCQLEQVRMRACVIVLKHREIKKERKRRKEKYMKRPENDK